MKRKSNNGTPLLEDKNTKIELDFDNGEQAASIRKRFSFFALLALVLLVLAILLIFKANQRSSDDALVNAEPKESELWQGAFLSKEIFESAKASSVSVIAEGKVCSGFVFSSDGWIATAEGIVNEYVQGQIEVALCDGRRFLVNCFKQDRESGLLLMKIDAEKLTAVRASKDTPSVGEELFTFCCINDDFSEGSLFSGKLSHVARQSIITRTDGRLCSLPLLQIAFLLTEEGVGAPLYNSSGELVGIALSQKNNGERFIINYALPSEHALLTLSTLYSD